MRAFWDVALVVSLEQTIVLEVRTAPITTLMIVAVRTSDTSVYSNKTTRHYIPECSHLHTRRRENMKSDNKFWEDFYDEAEWIMI
jgi:hypothetical protein